MPSEHRSHQARERNATSVPVILEFDTWRVGDTLHGRHRASCDLIEADSPRRLAPLAMAKSVVHTWREAETCR
ncbi:hypothetical protein ACTWPT_31565 [Nonomuraea sp. 3N208]|uniref:hypothetical protein n=1 Tax=Nonomuraea sp. 3N208 TaxID=3457421 RepID=UPI003FD5F9D3